MKIVRFAYKNKKIWGVIQGEDVFALKEPPYEKIILRSKKIPLSQCRIIAPAEPSKIILTGLNYIDHAKELKMKIPKEPVIFLKPPTTLIGPDEKIIYPKGIRRLDYEAELAVILKKKCKNISVKDAEKYILGYTCLNDVTARDLQSKDIQWSRAKSFDTFCPVGPFIETGLDPSNLSIRLYLNGRLKQDSSTKNFIFPVKNIVSFISRIMTLLPGDIISTGTPPGVGRMKPADTVEVVIEGIGRLRNKVA